MSATKPIAPKETVTAQMSRWAAGLKYQDLGQDAVYQAKRFLLDSLGCALGGYQQHDVKIALAVLDEVAGPGSATVIGTGQRTLGAVTAGKLTMMKNTVDPMATQSGVFAALLAEHGYTGPEHVVDGKEGLAHVFGPDWKFDLLMAGLGESWRITQCGMKAFPTEALTHTPISAVLDLVKTNDLRPDRVEKIQIRSLARAADILSDPSKYDPHTKETADHSLPYVIAAALVDRKVTPAQFTMEKIMDEKIREQLKKVEVVADPEIEKVFPALQRVIVNINTTDGRCFSKQLDYPKGDPRNPLTDHEVEEKFSALAEGVLSRNAQKRVKDAVWSLEHVESVSRLMALMEADIRKRPGKVKGRKMRGRGPRKSPKPIYT